MTQPSRKECWCGHTEPPVEILPSELVAAGIPEELLVRHRRFWQCRSYCEIVSATEGGQRVALGYLSGSKWTAANPDWHRPLAIPTLRAKRGGGPPGRR